MPRRIWSTCKRDIAHDVSSVPNELGRTWQRHAGNPKYNGNLPANRVNCMTPGRICVCSPAKSRVLLYASVQVCWPLCEPSILIVAHSSEEHRGSRSLLQNSYQSTLGGSCLCDEVILSPHIKGCRKQGGQLVERPFRRPTRRQPCDWCHELVESAEDSEAGQDRKIGQGTQVAHVTTGQSQSTCQKQADSIPASPPMTSAQP